MAASVWPSIAKFGSTHTTRRSAITPTQRYADDDDNDEEGELFV
jgi:hypothetical protein